MDLLACPECGRFPLELTVFETESVPGGDERHHATEITEAALRCGGCGQQYPVIGGIPRFNPDVRSDYPEFFRKHGGQFGQEGGGDVESFHALHTETKRSFGYQWLRYRVTDAEENRRTFYGRTATEPGTLSGQIFFEAGCGMGRYLKVIGEEPGA